KSLLATGKGAAPAAEAARSAAKLLRDDHPTDLKLNTQLLLAATLEKAGDKKDLPAVAAELDKLAAALVQTATGDDGTLAATVQMASSLLGSPAAPVADLGLEYARKAVKLLTDKTRPDRKAVVYKLLSRGLESRGQKDEVKKLEPIIEKL